MLNRLLMVAVVAGVLTGVLSTAVQLVWAVPLVHAAEVYEVSGDAGGVHHHGGVHATDGGHAHAHVHEHGEGAWGPADGAERTLWTLVTNVSLATGVSLIVAGLFLLRGSGSAREGIVWGGMGFLAFSLAPALGLPPELPGAAAAALESRQMWWLFTAASTLLALVLLRRTRQWWVRLVAAGIAVAPHAVGAPHPVGSSSPIPQALQGEFIAASLLSMLVFWLALGAFTGAAFERFRVLRTAGDATQIRDTEAMPS